jgi:hypothetical protein
MQEREFMRLGGMDTIKVDVPHHRRDELRSAGDGGRRAIPGGSLLPPARDQHLPATAAASEGRTFRC